MTKKTELTTQENKLPVDLSTINWDADVTDMSDMLIPRLQLMQLGSEPVAQGKAKFGDIIDSVSGDVLGSPEQVVELVPIMVYKEWTHYDITKGKANPEYLGREPWSPANAGYQKQETKGNQVLQHIPVISCFMLPAGRPNDLPYLVSFQKSSYNVGKLLSTHFQMAQTKKYAPWATVFGLSSLKTSYEGFNYCVYDAVKLRECKPEEFKMAEKWRATLTQSKVQVDEAEEVKTTSSRLSQQAKTVEAEIPL